ncbi:uncharacterized protein [Anabrus simplex]|uniref:uncharacterized protein n=1 Tax=Anabrus simplex TaxID=316456 RepID=UPI0034DD468B
MSAPCMKELPEIECERWGDVSIWWFPRDFSQSRYGDRNTGSNACTLIALLVAQRCNQNNIKIWTKEDFTLNKSIITALAESILEGNEIHERLLREGVLQHVNMTVPEAIEAAGSKMKIVTEWKSLVYLMDLGESLYEQLNETIAEWNRNPPMRRSSDLYVILIADNRTVLLVFQKELDTVTLIDSHQHLSHGAVLAQVSNNKLQNLCKWYHSMLLNCYGVRPVCYELSFLYFKCYDSGEMATS